MKSKNKLNSVAGMTEQDPVIESVMFQDGIFKIDDSKDEKELLEESCRRAFIPYQWGVWCTAWGRWELEQGLKLAHGKNSFFVYGDTDSIKYLGYIDWTAYNTAKIAASKKSGAFATDKKETYTTWVFLSKRSHIAGLKRSEQKICIYTLG